MTEPTYTVFIRVPIPRGDFIDPPSIKWNASKDEALWNLLPRAARAELDWNDLAIRFDAPVEFLLQQVAYLTERHASQVRAQARNATAAAKVGFNSPGAEAMAAMVGHARTTSALSIRRAEDGVGSAGIPIATSMRSRVPRNNTVGPAEVGALPSRAVMSAKAPALGRPASEAVLATRRQSSLLSAPPATSTTPTGRLSPLESAGVVSSPGASEEAESSADPLSSSGSSDSGSSPAQSRIIRRPPRFPASGQAHQQQDQQTAYQIRGESGSAGVGVSYDDGDDTDPAFRPYNPQGDDSSSSSSAMLDLGATLRGDPRAPQTDAGTRRAGNRAGVGMERNTERGNRSQTSDSSAGSAAIVSRPARTGGSERHLRLAGASSRVAVDGSDGTPSMGSSFSDLEDASVTQSALEEALLSKMQDGAAGSRFSISQAFRSRHAGAAPSTVPSGQQPMGQRTPVGQHSMQQSGDGFR